MEKPTFTAIDYNSLENRVIEGLVGDYYQMVKNTFETVLYGRIHIQDSPRGLCADLIEVSRNIYKQYDQYDLPDRIFLWRQVIKPWFTPQRFNLTYVYFGYSTPLIQHLKEEVLDINGRVWFKVPLEKLKDHEYLLGLLGTAFWFPISKEHNDNRIKILECALEDLAKLTQEEEEILELTAELWNKFLQLPIYHLMEQSEMQYKIHDIQRMIIARPGFRMNKEIFRDYGEG